MRSECDGCINMDISDDCRHTRIPGCPCQNCLVKVICKLGCTDLSTHYKKIQELEMGD